MELTFNNNAAEFLASTHFNLHIEGASASLYKRTSGAQWDFVKTLNGAVIDEDVAVTIPKDYRIVCAETPKMCVVTFADGTIVEADIQQPPMGESSVTEITFSVEGKSYKARKGMTFLEFIESEYNVDGWTCEGDYDYVYTSYRYDSWDDYEYTYITYDHDEVRGNTTIESKDYMLQYESNDDGILN